MFRRISRLAVIAAVTFLVSSHHLLAQEARKIRIGYQTGEINVILSYAVGKGLFKQNGLDVTVSQFPAGPAMLPAIAAGEIDLAWMGEFPAVTGFANGLPVQIIFMERIDATNVRLAANPAAGIASLSDLKGKRIGVAVGSTSHYHLLRALEKAGLQPSDVTLVNLSPANMPPAYVAGQIDAAFVWEPNVGAIERAGAKPIATTKSLDMITGGVWVARKGFVNDSPEALQLFLRTWDQAQQDYKKDPAGVRAYEAKRIDMTADQFDKLVEGQGVAHPTFEQVLTSDFMGPPGHEADSRLGKHLQGIAAFLLREKRIQSIPTNWSDLLYTKPVQTYLDSRK
jgi:aliphatic sulfonates family ABC transporter substrate-binding protein